MSVSGSPDGAVSLASTSTETDVPAGVDAVSAARFSAAVPRTVTEAVAGTWLVTSGVESSLTSPKCATAELVRIPDVTPSVTS